MGRFGGALAPPPFETAVALRATIKATLPKRPFWALNALLGANDTAVLRADSVPLEPPLRGALAALSRRFEKTIFRRSQH